MCLGKTIPVLEQKEPLHFGDFFPQSHTSVLAQTSAAAPTETVPLFGGENSKQPTLRKLCVIGVFLQHWGGGGTVCHAQAPLRTAQAGGQD